MPYYAVKNGRNPGIYKSWDECQAQVSGFSGAIFKKFTTHDEAEAFVGGVPVPTPVPKKVTPVTHRQISHDDIDQEKDIVSFVDGSSVGNGSSTAKAGYGVYIPLLNIKKSVKLPDGSTNNQGELLAILTALQIVPTGGKRHVIVSDSQYSIKCVTEWGPMWKSKGWKKSGGGAIANLDTIKEIMEYLDKDSSIVFSHINSHTGKSGFLYEGNAVADQLAGSA